MPIISLFSEIDDFFLAFEKQMMPQSLPVSDSAKKRRRTRCLHTSEVMTILVDFHQSRYRSFKHYYQKHVAVHLRWAFPYLVSYNRFVELMSEALLPLSVYLQTRFGKRSGLSLIDSTPLAVCKNRRIPAHRVFAEEAALSKNSLGWFYGFKLHLVINERGELLWVALTPANIDDRRPVAKLTQRLFGKLYGDKGYISQKLAEALETQGLFLVYKVRKNMKTKPLSDFDAVMLKKRMLVESVINQLKNQSQLEHTRHRSFVNFQVNAVCALIAYTWQEKKPSLNLRALDEIKDLPVTVN